MNDFSHIYRLMIIHYSRKGAAIRLTNYKKLLGSKSVPVKKHKPHVPVDEYTENVKHIPIKTEGGMSFLQY